MEGCRGSSIIQCYDCKDSRCKNLWGPIKVNSKCYDNIKKKLFDECMSEKGLVPCDKCCYMSKCNNLLRQSVLFM